MRRTRIMLAVALAAALALLAIGATASASGRVVTGSINLTTPWACNSAVDLDRVHVELGPEYGKTTNAISIGEACTGRIGRLECVTYNGDCVKVARTIGPLDVNGGYVRCYARIINPTGASVHQDGVQFLGSDHVHFRDFDDRCYTANDSDWFITINVNDPSDLSHDVGCDGCYFGASTSTTYLPKQDRWLAGVGPSSTVFLTQSAVAAYVRNSVICPGSNFQFRNGATGVDTAGTTLPRTCTGPRPPRLSVPAPITAEATGTTGAKVSYAVTATDDRDLTLPVSCSKLSGTIFPVGVTTVSCSASDPLLEASTLFKGQAASTEAFTVTVSDAGIPTVPTGLRLVSGAEPDAVEVAWNASTDDVGVAGYRVYVDGSLVSDQQATSARVPVTWGQHTVEVAAYDAAGNTSARAALQVESQWAVPSFRLLAGLAAQSPVGVMGCSQTRLSTEGYHTLGGSRLWDLGNSYAEGTPYRWWNPYGSASKYWRQFRGLFAANPGTSTIWWQLCIYASETDAQTWSAAVSDLAYLRSYLHDQGVTNPRLFVSAINGYVAPHCAPETSTGCAGPQRARDLRDRILTDPATAGPDLAAGPLMPDALAFYCVPSLGATPANNQVLNDCIHINDRGELLEGGALLDFNWDT